MTVGTTVFTAGHGQIVYRTETCETGIAANLIDSTIQNNLVFALYKKLI